MTHTPPEWEAQRPERRPVGRNKGLRWAFGVPMTVLNLVACTTCYHAVSASPYVQRGDFVLTRIEAMCCMTFACAALAICLSCLPLARQVVSRWWMAAPLTLILIAATRWASLFQPYSESTGT